ncbi:hypothetical protein TeGR_g705, partial [Tetraparma gracilis]
PTLTAPSPSPLPTPPSTQAATCNLSTLADLLAGSGFYPAALKASAVTELEESIAGLNRKKAEAALEDRFEEALELRSQINEAKAKIPSDDLIAEWRAMLLDAEKCAQNQAPALKQRAGWISGIDASEGASGVVVDRILSEVGSLWAAGTPDQRATAADKFSLLLACVKVREEMKTRGAETVLSNWTKLLGVCASELAVGRMMFDEVESGGAVGKEVKEDTSWAEYCKGLREIVRVCRLVGAGVALAHFGEPGEWGAEDMGNVEET